MSKHSTPIVAAYDRVRADLVANRHGDGYWRGHLASSALATATAISALALHRRHGTATGHLDEQSGTELSELIFRGLKWLSLQQNDDGGWGDTDLSHSNIATTMLVLAAFQLTGVPAEHADLLSGGEEYIRRTGGVAALRRRYGRDKTFVIPILTNCALAEMVPWHEVSPLPFELACLPQSWYRFARMPVVSYAIPALVAVGQARFFHQPPWNPATRAVRKLAVGPSLRVLRQMQPASGGYLGAIPLTSFVVMSLAATDRVTHPVVSDGVRFLTDTAREDGSWPIDTDLATWNTTLAVNAITQDGQTDPDDIASLDWLLDCQHRQVHPFTGAAPGGWGWSDQSGAVPDADDTAGALLALRKYWQAAPDDRRRERIERAAADGVRWLLDLQNRDGGWPTFCRGWGKLPFDRSGTDLTAHALRALHAWQVDIGGLEVETAMQSGWAYLTAQQRSDGSWLPLWFGNQDRGDESNPVYGTARVLMAFADCGRADAPEVAAAQRFLVKQQLADGSWGGPPGKSKRRPTPGFRPGSDRAICGSVEETAVAVEALSALQLAEAPATRESDRSRAAAAAGVEALTRTITAGQHLRPSPIGFYFAKLWYYEQSYPLTFSVSALATAIRLHCHSAESSRSPAEILT